MTDKLLNIPLKDLSPPTILFRSLQKNVEFQELVESIKTDGVLQPILVRPTEEGYEVVEGNHRFHAAKINNLETIPCKVKELTDDEVMLLQLKAHAVRPRPTNKYQFARRLKKLLENKYTIGQLSAIIDKTPDWISDTLALNSLIPRAASKLEDNLLSLGNAFELSKLPDHLQVAFLDDACDMKVTDFKERARAAKLEYAELLNRKTNEFRAQGIAPRLRPIKDIFYEVDTNEAREVILTSCNATTPQEGWKAALAWMLKIDPYTISKKQQNIKEKQRKALTFFNYQKKQRELIKKLTFDKIGEAHEQ